MRATASTAPSSTGVEAFVATLGGVVCGMVAAAPLAYELLRGDARMGHGVGAVAVSFLLVQGVLIAAWFWYPVAVVPFGALTVLTFLIVVVAAVVIAELKK